uniref:apocytochrome b n=1 Tax=Dixoniella grisea TaxID=35153 RepID=UPI001FCD8BBE|nr:apocytochrome b [Dixoniella grisea]UNJ18990.1 apocytochrome b [Dixoniella grisea]
MQLFKKPLINIVNNHLIDYPTPINIHYAWNFGFLAAICLIIQILTGIFLAMHYTPHIDLAFLSVEHICRNVNFGWLLRYVHSNGASFFFIAVYIHLFRGLYYGSFSQPRQFVWAIGIIILLLMILTAFIGYVLPWGQMSLWGATVITSLASVVPLIGNSLVVWLWGDFSVSQATLNRFFSFHYLFPFIIAAMSCIHLAILHQVGSGNPLGVDSKINKISMYPYFLIKDFVGLIVFLIVFSFFIYFMPNVLAHSDNYIEANPMVTPHLIVPEWYFLPFYAILRSVPWKLGGVLAMLISILILVVLPWIHNIQIRSSYFRPVYKIFYWLFVACCLILGWIGSCAVEDPYVWIGQIATIFYFSYFLIIIPFLGILENFLVNKLQKI